MREKRFSMLSIYKSFNSNKYLHALMAVITTFVLYVVLLVVCGIVPFGNSTWLVYDMQRQYVDFYSYYQTLLSGQNNILYSPAINMGSSAVSLFSYYLTSPFLLISSLFDSSSMPAAITLMIGIKLSLSAGCCDFFLKHFVERDKSYTLLFSITYSLCAFMVSNAINPMWLDVFMTMPITILMLDRLIGDNKKIGYILSLAYSIWCNYYIAFMVCIFITMWFFFRFITNERRNVKTFITFALSSIYAVLLNAAILIPTAFELSGSPKDIFLLGLEANKRNLSIRELMSKFYFLSYDSIQAIFGTPLIYMGTIVLTLTILYYTNKSIPVKEKLGMAVMMIIFFISFMLDKMNLVWHAGMEPSGYPYREAFMFVFLCIACSCKCINSFKEGNSYSSVIHAFIISAIMMGYAFAGHYDYINKRMILCNIGLLLVIFTILFAYKYISNHSYTYKKSLEFIIVAVLLTVQTLELTVNSIYVYKNLAFNSKLSASEFRNTVSNTKRLVDVSKQDKSFFRIENMTPREQNDSLMYGYNGITHYSSAGSIYPDYFLDRLGYNDFYLYTDYGHNNTYTADSILGIKYLVNAERYRDDYEVIYGGRNGLVKNPYHLSVASMANNMPTDIKSADNPFKFQEKLYGDITGHDVSIFEDTIVNTSKDTTAETITNTYMCKAQSDGYVYMYIGDIRNQVQNLSLYLDNDFLSTYGNTSCMQILNLGYHDKDDEFTLAVSGDSSSNLGHTYIVTENIDKLSTAYDLAKDNSIDLKQLSSSKYEMTVLDDDTRGITTTIPYSTDWNITLNGKKIEPLKIYDTFLYIPISEAGTIKMSYIPKGVIPGAIISIASILGLIVFNRKVLLSALNHVVLNIPVRRKESL